jgi:thioredoxin 1
MKGTGRLGKGSDITTRKKMLVKIPETGSIFQFRTHQEKFMRRALYFLLFIILTLTPTGPFARGTMVNLTDATFNSEVLRGDLPVLVDFWAEWCGPCKMIAPILEDLSGKYAGKMKFSKLNVDDHEWTARRFGIQRIPCVKIFYRGRMLDELHGSWPREEIERFITRNLALAASR